MKLKLGFWGIFLPLAIKVLKAIATKVTPQLRKELGDYILEQDKKAKATANQFDDIFWDAIRRVLGI